MPWKETCPMHERLKLIASYDLGEDSVAGLARGFGVSRKTAYKWLERYRSEGPAGLQDQTRATKTHQNAVAPAVAELVAAARRRHPTWGPRKLVAWLERQHPEITFPAPSTCGDMLKRLGLVEPRRRRPAQPPRSTDRPGGYAAPNAVWCADFKGQFRMQDGALCYPLTITDGFSRFLLRCRGLRSVKESDARPVFESAFREHGLPEAIRTDNGAPFATRGLHGLSQLSVWWLKLGIWIERIEPGHPEQNGRHERMHRTLKRETAYPPKENLEAQQAAFDDFRAEYNVDRPHEALDQEPPASLYSPAPRPYPEKLGAPEYPRHFERKRVQSAGYIYMPGGGRVQVTQALADEIVGLEPIEEDLWSVHFGPAELATIDGRNGEWRVVPHAAGPAAWPLAWWLAELPPEGDPPGVSALRDIKETSTTLSSVEG
jgi:transposase InsO family protein